MPGLREKGLISGVDVKPTAEYVVQIDDMREFFALQSEITVTIPGQS